MHPKYEEDFYGWAIANAALLTQGKSSKVDVENIIEEMESMGRSEKSQLMNFFSVLIAHLLKWQLQPDFRERSWHDIIKEQRKRAKILLKDNPSLKSKLAEIFADAYELSVDLIEKETPIDLKLLPPECPYSFEDCLNDDFFPEEVESR